MTMLTTHIHFVHVHQFLLEHGVVHDQLAHLDSVLLASGSVNTPFAGGVGAIAKNVFFDFIVIKNGSGLHW